MATSEMWCWSGGRGILSELSLCYSIVYYYYNGEQWYEQFLQVSRPYLALIMLGLALCLPSASVSSVFMLLYIYTVIFFRYILFFAFMSWACRDWPFTWLTDHCPSMLWCCWLGHVTYKNHPKNDVYNVSSGMLIFTVLYCTVLSNRNSKQLDFSV